MAVLDTVKIIYAAEWVGNAAMQRIQNDLKSVQNQATNANTAFSKIGQGAAFNPLTAGAAKADLQMRVVGERARSLQAEMGKLASQVESGKASLESVLPAYARMKSELDGLSVTTEKTGINWSKLGTVVGASIGVLVAAGAAFKELVETAREGAVIAQTGDSFKYLSESVIGIPDLLEQMRSAARGTITDMDLMASFMTLVAGTSDELGARLGQAAPQLLEIARAANVLNPTLGDTTFFFDSLARGIKRSETRILDNLGLVIKAGQANKIYAESIGKNVKELTAEEKQIALLNETLRVGQNLIQQLGADAQNLVDPYQQVQVAIENASNALKEGFARGLSTEMASIGESSVAASEGIVTVTEALGGLAGAIVGVQVEKIASIGEAINKITEASKPGADPRQMAEGLVDYGLALDKIINLGGPMVHAAAEAFAAYLDLNGAFGDHSTVASEAASADAVLAMKIREVGDAASETRRQLDTSIGSADWLARVAERESGFDPLAKVRADREAELKKFEEEQKKAAEKVMDTMADALTGQLEANFSISADLFNPLAESAESAMKRISASFSLTREDLEALGVTGARAEELLTDQADAMADAFERIRDAAAESRKELVGMIDDMQDDPTSGFFTPERDVSFPLNGLPSKFQSEALERYQERLKDLGQDLFDLETGFATSGDSAEDQAKAISETEKEMRRVQRAIENLGVAETQYGYRHEQMKVNLDNVNASFFDMLVNAGAATPVIGAFGIEIGRFSAEEFNAAFAGQLLNARMLELADQVATGAISLEDAKLNLAGFIAYLEGNIPVGGIQDVVTTLGDVPPAIVAIKEEAANDIELQVNTETASAELDDFGKRIEDYNKRQWVANVEVRMNQEKLDADMRAAFGGGAFSPKIAAPVVDITADIHYNPLPAEARTVGRELGQPIVPDIEYNPLPEEARTVRAEIEETIYIPSIFSQPDTSAVDSARERVSSEIRIPVIFDTAGAPPTGGPRYEFPQFALGGFVESGRGLRGGAMPAILHDGEYVLNRQSVDRLGVNFLDNLNSGGSIGRKLGDINVVYNFYGGSQPSWSDRQSMATMTRESIVDELRRNGYTA